MKLITYATHNTGYFNSLKESAKKNNFELIIIGYGNKWEGFTKRINDIILYLKNINNNELVCIIDAFDCIVLGNAEEMKKKYNLESLSKLPEISRYDPQALAVMLRPGQVVEFTRSSFTALESKYYRICINN
jgi:DNA-directed RNA polymerase subunit H (RpoH/RPB5)